MKDLFERAQRAIPLGVSSPLRACRKVNSEPLFIESGRGEILVNHDGREHVDYLYGFGPQILGHNPECVVEAVKDQIGKGAVYATGHRLEVELAEEILAACGHIDKLRFVCSGTEAVMSAVRVARAYTGRAKIIRFAGGYHGHSDIAQQGPAVGLSEGVVPSKTQEVILCEYNDPDGATECFRSHGSEIAAVLVEPVACNSSLIELDKAFLQHLHALSSQHGALLIFDEVISGFRFRFGTVAQDMGVFPDITTFGKIIGGGLPVGAYGGSAEIMALLESEKVYQSGTFSGSPMTMAAGLAVLKVLKQDPPYREMYAKASYLRDKMTQIAIEYGAFAFPVKGSVFSFQFTGTTQPARSVGDLKNNDRSLYARLYNNARAAGIHLAPDIDEVMYVSAASSYEGLDRLASVVRNTLMWS